jgi:hypothetical protein
VLVLVVVLDLRSCWSEAVQLTEKTTTITSTSTSTSTIGERESREGSRRTAGRRGKPRFGLPRIETRTSTSTIEGASRGRTGGAS